jgi:hypothetical protein
MKRNTLAIAFVFIVFAIAVVLITPSLSLAQQETAPADVRTISFDKPISVTELVTLLCKESGYEIVFDDPIPATVMFTGEIKAATLPAMLEQLLGRHGFEASPSGWTMHIRRKGSPPPNATPRDPNRVYYPDGTSVTMERWKWLLHLYGPERMAEKIQDMRMRVQLESLTPAPDTLPQPTTAPVNTYPLNNVAPYMTRGRHGYYDPFWVNYMRQYQNAGVWGRLKIDGREGFLKNVHVFVDGHPLSPASKANGYNNEGLAIPVGNHDIQLMWLDKDTVRVLSWRSYTVRPMMVQKTNWIGGKKEIYERAPKATEEEEATYRNALGLTSGTIR